MNYKNYTKPQLRIRLEETKKQVDILRAKLAEQEAKSDLGLTVDYLRYVMDLLTSTGATREEAFDFIINGLKGVLLK